MIKNNVFLVPSRHVGNIEENKNYLQSLLCHISMPEFLSEPAVKFPYLHLLPSMKSKE